MCNVGGAVGHPFPIFAASSVIICSRRYLLGLHACRETSEGTHIDCNGITLTKLWPGNVVVV
jgi:hypothetical protein